MADRAALTRPSPLQATHDLSAFFSRHQALDDWLRNTALRSEGRTARSYVVCAGNTVVGYYCLATGSVVHAGAPGRLRRNAPDPVPVAIVGRLAVSRDCEGRGIGSGMLQDGLRRVLHISQSVGCAAVIVHAIDEEACAFYVKYGFTPFADGARTFFMPVAAIAAAL